MAGGPYWHSARVRPLRPTRNIDVKSLSATSSDRSDVDANLNLIAVKWWRPYVREQLLAYVASTPNNGGLCPPLDLIPQYTCIGWLRYEFDEGCITWNCECNCVSYPMYFLYDMQLNICWYCSGCFFRADVFFDIFIFLSHCFFHVVSWGKISLSEAAAAAPKPFNYLSDTRHLFICLLVCQQGVTCRFGWNFQGRLDLAQLRGD